MCAKNYILLQVLRIRGLALRLRPGDDKEQGIEVLLRPWELRCSGHLGVYGMGTYEWDYN